MRVSYSARVLGDTLRYSASVTDGMSLVASSVIDGGDGIAALESLELLLGQALAAVREKRTQLEQEAA